MANSPYYDPSGVEAVRMIGASFRDFGHSAEKPKTGSVRKRSDGVFEFLEKDDSSAVRDNWLEALSGCLILVAPLLVVV